MLAILQTSLFTGMAINRVTNCKDRGTYLPLPRRMTSDCLALGVLDFDLFNNART